MVPLRIALVSNEYPPDTGGGGIGTYLATATRMLRDAGHDVVVFAEAGNYAGLATDDGIPVHRVRVPPGDTFAEAVAPRFAEIHEREPFDVIEGNDYLASALFIKRRFPELPYVVKLHTPLHLIRELHREAPTFRQRLRMHAGAWRRGQSYRPFDYRGSADARMEIESIRLADEIASPSQAIAERLVPECGVPWGRVSVFPYCFVPPPALLQLSPPAGLKRIGFVGRLEVRKGALDLAHAFKTLARRHPSLTLRMIGRDMRIARRDQTVSERIRKLLGPVSHRVEFTGPQPYAEATRLMAECDVLVFPSHWESFGLVCCEAMAAARPVVGSRSGGMKEILNCGEAGCLVDPMAPDQIVDAIEELLCNPKLREDLAVFGRERVRSTYSPASVLPQQLASYERAIAHVQTAAGTPI